MLRARAVHAAAREHGLARGLLLRGLRAQVALADAGRRSQATSAGGGPRILRAAGAGPRGLGRMVAACLKTPQTGRLGPILEPRATHSHRVAATRRVLAAREERKPRESAVRRPSPGASWRDDVVARRERPPSALSALMTISRFARLSVKRRRRPWPVAHRDRHFAPAARAGRGARGGRPAYRGRRPAGDGVRTRVSPRRRGGRESDRGRSSGGRSGHRSGRSRPVAGPDGVSGPWSAAGVIGCDAMACGCGLGLPVSCLGPVRSRVTGVHRHPGSWAVRYYHVSYIRTSGKHPHDPLP